jgi:hypothetical protein
MQQLIKAVREYAVAHYEEGGWDILVECWEDADIAKPLARANSKTPEDAIAIIGTILGVQDSYRRDIQSEVF